MDCILKKITDRDIDKAAELLSESFAEDKGVLVLFNKNQSSYSSKVRKWFTATLKLLLTNDQYIIAAYNEHKMTGIMLVSHTAFKPTHISLFSWTLSVLFFCGFGTVLKSAQHDQGRKKTFTNQNQLILEFIAVSPKYRGRGIGQQLFNELNNHAIKSNTSVWLETTKQLNVKIFSKMNYHLINTFTERSIQYYIMSNENYLNASQSRS